MQSFENDSFINKTEKQGGETDGEEREERPAIQLSLEQGDWDQEQTNSPLLRGKREGEVEARVLRKDWESGKKRWRTTEKAGRDEHLTRG